MPKETSLCPLPSSHRGAGKVSPCPASSLPCCTPSHLQPVSELDYSAFRASQSSSAPCPLPGEPAGSAEALGQAGRAQQTPEPLEGKCWFRAPCLDLEQKPLPAMKAHEVKPPQGSELPLLLLAPHKLHHWEF